MWDQALVDVPVFQQRRCEWCSSKRRVKAQKYGLAVKYPLLYKVKQNKTTTKTIKQNKQTKQKTKTKIQRYLGLEACMPPQVLMMTTYKAWIWVTQKIHECPSWFKTCFASAKTTWGTGSEQSLSWATSRVLARYWLSFTQVPALWT